MGINDNLCEIVFQKEGVKPAKVTVAITLYNYDAFIEQTLDSVSMQSLSVLDIVIAEDHSTDSSLKVASNWLEQNANRFNSIKLVHHKENQGLGLTRNTSFRFSQTPYIFVLDADNIIYPKAIEKLLTGLENSNASFAYSYLEHFGDSTKLGGLQVWNPELLPYGNTIDAMVLIKKSKWDKVGGYSEDMPYNGWEDYEFWFKISESGGWGVRIPEILCKYRVHTSSMLHTETNKKIDALKSYLKDKYPNFNFPS